ncbi:hypothetical protein MMC11_004433 [Xylographa trunciseda]|nr:hypothetical protein [Xylographa trunciseda]
MAGFEKAASIDHESLSQVSVAESNDSDIFEDALALQTPSILNDEEGLGSGENHRQVFDQVVNYQPPAAQYTLVNVQPVHNAPSPPLAVSDHTRDSSLVDFENYQEVLQSNTASYVDSSADGDIGPSADLPDSFEWKILDRKLEADRELASEIEKRRNRRGIALNLDSLDGLLENGPWNIREQPQPNSSVDNSGQGMSDLIRDAFNHLDGLEACVDRGWYDLLDSDNYIILPAAWESLVRPGWSLRIRVWRATKRLQELYKLQNGDYESNDDCDANAILSTTSFTRNTDLSDWLTISTNATNSDTSHQTQASREDSQSTGAELVAPESDYFELEAYRSESAASEFQYHKTAYSREALIASDQKRMGTSYARREMPKRSIDIINVPTEPSVARRFVPMPVPRTGLSAREIDVNAGIKIYTANRLKNTRREDKQIVLEAH